VTAQPDYPRYSLLADGRVVQALPDGLTALEPATWQRYRRASGAIVRACRIPGPFVAGGVLCGDGWLVLGSRGLRALGDRSFSRQYRQLGTRSAEEIADGMESDRQAARDGYNPNR
jgi:hypothetical protein